MVASVRTDLTRLRAEFASEVITRAGISSTDVGSTGVGSELVAAALRDVPRHVFLPEIPAVRAYTDEPYVTMRDADGRPVSSSSQPAIMVLMLDQLALQPGHRVLEIGAGTGYNAALMRHITGADGMVVTIDIEPEAVTRARAALARAGYPDVTVTCADGAEGYSPSAPYDRLIATVGISDLAPAWLDQLADDAILVAPLDLGGMQCSVAFARAGDLAWRSRSVVPCGFIRMRGALAGPDQLVPLTDRLAMIVPGRAMRHRHPAGPLVDALAAPATARVATGLAADDVLTGGGLELWLSLRELRCCFLSEEAPPSGRWLLSEAAARWPAFRTFRTAAGITDAEGSIATLTAVDGELTATGHGPAGPALATALAARAADWDAAGRPGGDRLRVIAWPRPPAPSPPLPRSVAPGEILLDRPSTRFTIGYES
jgi:protein-L-isoaspartate(D-aspartate) O-methyltransferase